MIARLGSMFSRLKNSRLLVWGPTPLVNNKYWSAAMKKSGWPSVTLMSHHFGAFNRDDFDLYFDSFIPTWLHSRLHRAAGIVGAMWYILRRAAVVHFSFAGGPLGGTRFWKFEALLFRLAGVRTVLIPYGGDIWMYSRIPDPSVRHGLLTNYPAAGRCEREVAERVEYWTRNADAIVASAVMSATMLGRWDVLTFNSLCIDLEAWQRDERVIQGAAAPETVRIIHTPNHRLYKGTEYVVHAVDRLKNIEGLPVELVLLEGVSNETVRQEMGKADILVEQLINTGHGLSAVEGMACGLPVLANLENDLALDVFRRYGFLDECPIVSTSPETVLANLRALVLNPKLRRKLGDCSRRYVEKYHSYDAAQYLFSAVYERLLENKSVDLAGLFHPLKSEYSRDRPKIVHPLIRNRIPQDILDAAAEQRSGMIDT